MFCQYHGSVNINVYSDIAFKACLEDTDEHNQNIIYQHSKVLSQSDETQNEIEFLPQG